MNETDGGQICKDALKIRSRQCLNNWPSGKRNYTVYIIRELEIMLQIKKTGLLSVEHLVDTSMYLYVKYKKN